VGYYPDEEILIKSVTIENLVYVNLEHCQIIGKWIDHEIES
jgi:hypothetical protein